LSEIFDHQGPLGILSNLKNKGWVNKLSAGENKRARGIQFFDIDMDLTKQGLNHVDEIIKFIFQVIFYLFK